MVLHKNRRNLHHKTPIKMKLNDVPPDRSPLHPLQYNNYDNTYDVRKLDLKIIYTSIIAHFFLLNINSAF